MLLIILRRPFIKDVLFDKHEEKQGINCTVRYI